jgi:hypothetical protein
MTSTSTITAPVKGPGYDKTRPETRQAWLDFRRPGLTATMIRDWGNASRKRKILEEKATGVFEDLSHLPYVAHGNRREPIIAKWAQGKFGITPCDNTYAHPDNPRHLASPDGVSLSMFSGALLYDGPDAVLAEIKTSKHDLTPGTLDDNRTLIAVAEGSEFDRSNYYTQIQWQMYVMKAHMTLFVYEQHDDKVDPETGTFTPIGPPAWAFIPRNDALIDALLENVAPRALAEIDAALALRSTELPPASDFPAEDAMLVADVLKARDAEAIATKAKEAAWKTLQGKYTGGEDFTKDLGFATITVSTSGGDQSVRSETYVDEDAMRAKAPALMAKYDALREKYTKTRDVVSTKPKTQRMTITGKKD